MHPRHFRNATLVLVGHGSTRNRASALPVRRHAQNLRDRRLFGEVLEAFWLEEPRLSRLWERVTFDLVIIVPVFIGEGYFTSQAIPETLGLRLPGMATFDRSQLLHGRRVHYCEPVGSHPAMTEALLNRANAVLREFPGQPAASLRESTLIIGGHGTSRNDRSRTSIEHQVQLIRERHVVADVQPAFLEEEPRFADWPDTVRTRDVVVVPFFISDGLHTMEDIPVLLGLQEAEVQQRLQRALPVWQNPTHLHGHRVWYTPAIGTESFVSDIILQRVAEAG